MRRFILLLFLLTAFYAVHNYIWLKQNTPVPNSESGALHLNLMLTHYLPGLESGLLDNIKFGKYCPIYHLTASYVNKIFGLSIFNTRLFNVFWFMLALIGIYLLSRETFGDKYGLWAMIMFSLFPIVYGSSRMFLESISLMAMAPFAVYFLFRSNNFEKTAGSVLFGLFLGISFMTKKSAVVFLGLPVVYMILKTISRKEIDRKKILNIMIAMTIFVVIIATKYWDMAYLKFMSDVPFQEPNPVRGLYKDYLETFILGIVNYQLSLPFFMLFVYGVLKFIKSEIFIERKIVYFLWILIPILFFNFIPHVKMLRVILPYLPPIAILTAYGLLRLHNHERFSSLIPLIVIVGLIQFYDFSFYIGPRLEKLRFSINNGSDAISYFHCNNPLQSEYSLNFRPVADDYYYKLADAVKKSNISKPKLMFIMKNLQVNKLMNYFYFTGLPVDVLSIGVQPYSLKTVAEHIETVDMVVFNDDIERGFQDYIKFHIMLVKENFREHLQGKELAEYSSFLKSEEYKQSIDFIEKELANFYFVETFKIEDQLIHLYRRKT